MSRNNRFAEFLAFCLGILLVGVLIQWAGDLRANSNVFPGVEEILRAFLRLVREPKTWLLVRTTMLHLVQSMVVATVIGVGLGLLQGLSGLIRQLLNPLMVFLRSFPMIILIFVIMVAVKRDYYGHIPVLASALVLIPMISEAACEGCRRIDRELIDVYRMNSRLNLRVLTRVHLPLMSGYLRQAYINAVGMGVKLAVSTEYMVNIASSLGNAVQTSRDALEYQDVYAYALLMILLVVLISEAPLAVIRWHAWRKENRTA